MCECMGRIACAYDMSILIEDYNYLKSIYDASGHYGEAAVNINFCPMCGRKLEARDADRR